METTITALPTQTLPQLDELMAKVSSRRAKMTVREEDSPDASVTDTTTTKPSNLWVLFENCYSEKKCKPTMYEIDSKCLKSVVESDTQNV